MLERASEQKATQGAQQIESATLERLAEQIEDHRKHDRSRSYLGRLIGTVSSAFLKDEESLADMQRLYAEQKLKLKNGEALDLNRINHAVESDRKAVGWQDEITHYTGGFLKTAGLFMRGKIGLAGTIAIYALDQMNPGDSVKTQLLDMTLGSAKGGLMKGAFHLMGEKPVGVAAKGVGLGVTARTLEFGLTRSTYIDPATGQFNLTEGLSRTAHGMFNKTALAADVLIFAGAHGLVRGANRLSLGALDRSPLLTTMLTGTGFGLSSGATGEILRQQATGESFDLGKVVKRSLIQGALDTLAAAPGGVQADPRLRARVFDYASRTAQSWRFKLEGLKTSMIDLADSVSLGGRQLVPAFAGVPGGRISPYEAVRPSRDALENNVMNMMDGGTPTSGSGADINGILGSGKVNEPRLTGNVEPGASERPAGTENPAPAERPLAAGPPVDLALLRRPEILAEVAKTAPGQEPALERFEELVVKAGVSAPGSGERQQLFEYLKAHPGLESLVMRYEGLLLQALRAPGPYKPEQIASMMRTVNLIGEFYKTENPRIFVTSADEAQSFQQLKVLLSQLKLEQVASDQAVFNGKVNEIGQLLARNPALRELVRQQFLPASKDPLVVAVLDHLLATDYAPALKEHQAWRKSLARAAEATAPAEDVPAAAEGDKPSPFEALRKAKPYAATAEVAENTGVAAGQASAAGTEKPVAPAVAEKLAELNSANRSVRTKAARELGERIGEMTEEQFLAWKELAVREVLLGGILKREDVSRLPFEILQRFLSKQEIQADKPVPEWAKEHVEASKKLAEQRAAESGRPQRTPRPVNDNLQHRLLMLEKALDAFKGDPALGAKLVELGAADRQALDAVLFSMGHPKLGQAYKDLIKGTVAYADSIEPLKYLVQFLKEGNADGAFAALLELKPQAEAIDRWITERKLEAGEDVDPVEISNQAEAQAEAQWQQLQRLMHDMLTGNIRPPRQEGGPGGGRGGRFGGRGGDRDRNRQQGQ